MPLPFDATFKDILQKFTRDFEEQLGLVGPQPAVVLNVDLSTISAATDIVLGYGDPPIRLVDLNFQSSRDAELSRRLLMYHALLHHRYGVPVHSLVVLLRPAADDPALSGELRYQAWPRRGRMLFQIRSSTLMAAAGAARADGSSGHAALGAAVPFAGKCAVARCAGRSDSPHG